ncbi:MAG: septum formation protein Maf, partial [Actinobacteria bacterium]|nr:septum formation protein Maf [Actinomycetota bacterium]
MTPSIVFLCVHNAGRSQMAAGWARHLGGDAVRVASGGSDPAAVVNPGAVAAMAEAGVDIGGATPQRWTDQVVREADVVVTMGCGDTCPVFPGVAYEDWPIPDPAGLSPTGIAPIRDELRTRVLDLLNRLGVAGGRETRSTADWTSPLVLASASARRREMLETVGIPVEIDPSDADESFPEDTPADQAVVMIAARKAADVAARHPGRPVLAADTMVRVDGLLLGKPTDTDDARRMLGLLSGRWHDVLSGVVLASDGAVLDRLAVTAVRLVDITSEEIERYVSGPEPYDKAGAYGIQAVAGWFIAEIRGSPSNVMGLPLAEVRE